MNIPLILITVLMVIIISYILSRPFLKADNEPEPVTTLSQYESQYDALLGEIKTLEVTFERTQDQSYRQQIEDKKEAAADLLILIDQEKQQPPAANPAWDAPHPTTVICPHCGRRVISGDKFCAYCGHRLQP